MRCLLAALALGLLASALAPRAVATPERPRAGLVLQLGDGQVRSICVELGGPEISGLELLERSGLDLAYQATMLGTMVCRIDRSGCAYPTEDCWCGCQSLSAGCRYWAYHQLEEGSWRYSITGPASSKVHDGDVEGWAWGPGSIVAGSQPPVMSFAQICRPAPAAPTASDPRSTSTAPSGASPTASKAYPARPRSTGQSKTASVTPSFRSDGPLTPPVPEPRSMANSTRTAAAAAKPSREASPEVTADPGSLADSQAGSTTSDFGEGRASSNSDAEISTGQATAELGSGRDPESSASRSSRSRGQEPEPRTADAGGAGPGIQAAEKERSSRTDKGNMTGYMVLLAMILLFGGMALIGRGPSSRP